MYNISRFTISISIQKNLEKNVHESFLIRMRLSITLLLMCPLPQCTIYEIIFLFLFPRFF